MNNAVNSQNARGKKSRERLIKAKERLVDKVLSFLKINIIIILLDIIIIKSRFTIPSFVILGTGIGLISAVFGYFSARARARPDRAEFLENESRQSRRIEQVSFYDTVFKEIEDIKDRIIKLLARSSGKVRNHKSRIMKDIDSIIASLKVLMDKGRNIELILKEMDRQIIEVKKREFEAKLKETASERLNNECMEHIKVLEHQLDRHKKLIEAEEMIRIKIESTKTSLSTMILDLSRIDLSPDQIIESELDTAIDNIELRTQELNTLSEIIDAERI